VTKIHSIGSRVVVGTMADDHVGVLSAVCFYWVVSIALVFLNKFVMSGSLPLDAPLFLTWTQFVVAIICCFILSSLRSRIQGLHFFPTWQFKLQVAQQILPLTFVFLGMVVFNNLCLKYVQVSFYQVARSLTIVFNIILSYIELGQVTSKRAMMAVGIVVIGYLAGVDGEIDFSWKGVFFGVSASFFVAWYSIYVKKVSKFVNNDSWLLLLYNNVNAAVFLPIIFMLSEERVAILETDAWFDGSFWIVVALTGVAGFLINIATYVQIEATSPLTHNVSGTAKAAAQTVLAFIVFGNEFTFFGLLGIVMTLGGSMLYTYIRMKESEIEKRAKAGYEAVKLDEVAVREDASPAARYEESNEDDEGDKAV